MPSNNLRLPVDAIPIVLSSMEAVRSEIFALLSESGWQIDAEFPETDTEATLAIKKAGTDALVIVADPEIGKAEAWVHSALANGLKSSRLILGVPGSSLQHRILLRVSGAESFLFDVKKSPLGPEINIDELRGCILRVVSNTLSQVVHAEIAASRDNGALRMLAAATGGDEKQFVERAVIASGILHSLTGRNASHQNAVRLALFYDVIRMDQWNDLVKNARRLWPIQEFFEEVSSSYRQDNPTGCWPIFAIETLAVESANIMIACRDLPTSDVIKIITQKIELQGIEIKAALPDAVLKIHQSAQEWAHEFAS